MKKTPFDDDLILARRGTKMKFAYYFVELNSKSEFKSIS